ncbi:hypothetical protein EW145_g3509 [Phellinidium pouzarii]|uniref:HotDog ACOT-type domain-containing protein n=1 Tax=Phellinidium pouzarii TaxID=167371 RepID=A0A4S4L8D3_9AGAM|nr:hypothetical protein EW145_g3509 [Phellinidium pouzarii]
MLRKSLLPFNASKVRLSRHFSNSCARSSLQSSVTKGDSTEAQVETHDVTTIDKLLKDVRSRSNPAYRSIMPMRSNRPWSQTLLKSSLDTAEKEAESRGLPTNASELPPRHMHDSYSQIDLPFASSPELLEQYVNAWGGIRTGKLMEHLDSLAGSIAYKHILDMLSTLHPVRDVRVSGHVIYTGRSSMEIAVKMEALEENDVDRTVMLGRFSMVCRDARTHKARVVNPLIASTPEEKALVAIGESHKSRKTLVAQQSLSRVPPSYEEAQALHDVYLSGLQQAKETTTSDSHEKVWMSDTKLEKTMLMFPQERNVHQKVFGGYLMRLAYEVRSSSFLFPISVISSTRIHNLHPQLGFTTAALFSRRRHLRFLSLDGIWFERPVEIGSILRLTAQVTHTSDKEFLAVVNVSVQARIIDVKTGTEKHTNDFKFTWGETEPGGEPLRRMVVPQTYTESMAWIEGKRALEYGEQIRSLRKPW